MDSKAIREEREVLDHQRVRIEEILERQIVSAEMADDLRIRLRYISQRLGDLKMTPYDAEQAPAAVFG